MGLSADDLNTKEKRQLMNRTARGILGFAVLGWVTVGCSDNSGPVGVSASDPATGPAVPSVLKLAAEETIGFAGIPAGTVDPVINVVTGTVTTAATGCVNIATIYDTSAGPGADPDLDNQAAQGEVLIIEENDGDGVFVENPDDCVNGGTLTLDFSGVGPLGTVTLEAAKVLDIEAAGVSNIELFAPGGASLGVFLLPVTAPPPSGDGGIATVGLGPTSGVEVMVVTFDTSGAIDDIEFSPDRGGEGCTPGYYKNLRKHLFAWTDAGWDPNDPVSSMFSESANAPYATLGAADLIDGLSFQGGNSVEEKAEILLRAGIAAVLNADNPNVSYPFASVEIIDAVNAALASQNIELILFVATILDGANNGGCPLGNGN